MPLVTRISRLFKADFNAVLENIEEPELLLQQAVREMEEEIVSDQQQLKWLTHEIGELDSKRDELAKTLLRLNDELDLCFDSGKDELAKGLVKRKLEAERFERNLVSRHETTNQNLEQLRTQIAERTNTLESMRQKAALFATTKDSHGSEQGGGDWLHSGDRITDDEIEIALLRERQLRSES